MKIFAAMFFTFLALTCNCQTYEDVVYLKSGSVIHGMIVEQVPNQSIKIKSGENLFVFKIEEILKMTKEATALESQKNTQAKSIPTENAARSYISQAVTQQSNNHIKLVTFVKTNGVEQPYGYEIDYEITIQPTTTVYKAINGLSKYFEGMGWADFRCYTEPDPELTQEAQQRFDDKQLIKIAGAAYLKNSENGWIGISFKNKTAEATYAPQIPKQPSSVTEDLIVKGIVDNATSTAENIYLTCDALSCADKNDNGVVITIKNSCSTCSDEDFALFKSRIAQYYLGSKRFKKTDSLGFQKIRQQSKGNLSFALEKATYVESTFSNGIKSWGLTIDYGCTILDGYGKTIKVEHFVDKGGNAFNADGVSKSYAEIQAYDAIGPKALTIGYYCFPIYSEFKSIIKEGKSDVKQISISNVQYVDKWIDMEWLLNEADSVYVNNDNEINMHTIAQGSSKQNENGGDLICKIYKGGDMIKAKLEKQTKIVLLGFPYAFFH